MIMIILHDGCFDRSSFVLADMRDRRGPQEETREGVRIGEWSVAVKTGGSELPP